MIRSFLTRIRLRRLRPRLEKSCTWGDALSVKAILDKGIDADETIHADPKITPLACAIAGSNVETTRFLLSAAADPNLGFGDGTSPLHFSIPRKVPEIVRLLVNAGGDVAARDNDGLTPLHLAVAYDQTEMVQILLQGGAPLNAKCSKGLAAIHIAAYHGRTGSISLLLEAGAAINITEDDFGRTPFDVAICGESPEIAPLLAARGARARSTFLLATVLNQRALPDDIALSVVDLINANREDDSPELHSRRLPNGKLAFELSTGVGQG